MGRKPKRMEADNEFEVALEVYANKLAIKCSSCKGGAVITLDAWVLHSDLPCGDSLLKAKGVLNKMYCYDCQSTFYAHVDVDKLSSNNFH